MMEPVGMNGSALGALEGCSIQELNTDDRISWKDAEVPDAL